MSDETRETTLLEAAREVLSLVPGPDPASHPAIYGLRAAVAREEEKIRNVSEGFLSAPHRRLTERQTEALERISYSAAEVADRLEEIAASLNAAHDRLERHLDGE